MGILFSEVKYYTAESVNFNDDTVNGGGPGAEIVNDTLHSIFPEISASEREAGFKRYAKYFVFNESTTRTMQDCIFYIKQDIIPPDRLTMYEALEYPSISFDNVADLLGSSSAVAAGTSIEIANISPNTYLSSDLVGRKVEIAGSDFTVDSSIDATHITFAEDITIDILAGATLTTNDDYDTFQSDQDFIAGKKLINSLIKSTVTTGSSEVYIPIVDKLSFEIGDRIVIVDGYFRAVYRGTILDVQDHATDTEIAVVTLENAYTSTVSIPSNEGYLCNGLSKTLSPGEGKSFWLELNVSPSDAIDAEIVNQFQLGTHFDDVTAP